jgi:hypothetical protein
MMSIQLLNWFYGYRKRIIQHIFRTEREELTHRGNRLKYRCRAMPVADGWYMIGGCSLPAQKMVTSGKIDVIYGYTQGYGYTRLLGSEPLEPGKGYWILFSNTSEGAEFTASSSVSE